MTRYTDRWGLSILGPGDSLQDDGFKAVDADIRLYDRLLKYAVEDHHHTGAIGTDWTPITGLNLLLETAGGAIPSGTRYYYRYTIVDADGNESAGSPAVSIDMPLALTAPSAPATSYLTGSGDLDPGTYSYVCSAYKDANTLETKALNSAAIRIPGTDPNNSVTLILPDLPLGATGLNVYRRAPNGLHYLYITSIAAPDSGDTWLDDGSITGDCDRSLPALNRTSNDNLVNVTLPGATPSIPDGWSWRIYRTENPSDWGRSFLAEVTPQGATPLTPTTYPDVGAAVLLGGPPSNAQVIQAPSKITFTDAAEIQGSLPPGRLVVPHVVTFTQAGPLTVGQGTFTWVCDYDQVDIISCRAHLGVDSVPAATDVIVDVNALRPSAGSSTWTSIYGGGPDRPTVPVGENVGIATVPTIVHLEAGDALSVDVDQTGGGATPTDENLTVNILMYAQYGSTTASYTWTP